MRGIQQLLRRTGADDEAGAGSGRGAIVARRQDRTRADNGGTSVAVNAMASIASSVRKVISIALRPPRTSACASGTASASRSILSTGITGWPSSISMRAFDLSFMALAIPCSGLNRFMRAASIISAAPGQHQLRISHACMRFHHRRSRPANERRERNAERVREPTMPSTLKLAVS